VVFRGNSEAESAASEFLFAGRPIPKGRKFSHSFQQDLMRMR